jgi:hypothetical protein
MDEEEMIENAELLKSALPGKKVPGKVRIRCRYKNLVDFAKVFGFEDPKYVGPEEDGIVACKAFANHFTIKALYKLLLGMKIEQDGKKRPFILNPGKLLHAGNKYNWDNCVDIKDGDSLTITAEWGNVWLVEKNMILFAELLVTAKNQNDELVCRPTVTAAVRPGGY